MLEVKVNEDLHFSLARINFLSCTTQMVTLSAKLIYDSVYRSHTSFADEKPLKAGLIIEHSPRLAYRPTLIHHAISNNQRKPIWSLNTTKTVVIPF